MICNRENNKAEETSVDVFFDVTLTVAYTAKTSNIARAVKEAHEYAMRSITVSDALEIPEDSFRYYVHNPENDDWEDYVPIDQRLPWEIQEIDNA